MSVSYETIRMETPEGEYRITAYRMEIKPNQHGFVYIKAVPEGNGDEEVQAERFAGKKVRVLSGEDILFHGIVKDISTMEEAGYTEIMLTLVTGTWVLDQERKSRSFQNTGMTYRDVVEKVLADTSHGGVLFGCKDKAIGQPLIQYQETDFDFIKRLASHFHTSIIPEPLSGEAKLWFGPPSESSEVSFSEEEYTIGRDETWYREAGISEGLRHRDFVYYELESGENYRIGNTAVILGRKVKILFICSEIKNGLMSTCYRLGKNGLLGTGKKYHDKMIGALIDGTVLDTRAECIKVHLDIDSGQDIHTAYEYPWMPETGSLSYCMPEVGERVSLYMGGMDEQCDAKVIRCSRTNGETVPELTDPGKRYFTTAQGKRMYLFQKEMGLTRVGNGSPLEVAMKDGEGISLLSPGKIVINARAEIALSAEKITVKVPKQVSVIKSRKGKNAVLNIYNQFDISGAGTGIKTTGLDAFNWPEEEPEEPAGDPRFLNGKALAAVPTFAGEANVIGQAVAVVPQRTGGRSNQ